MLSKFMTCGVGFIVAILIFFSLAALGRSQFREYVPSPAVRVLRSVPLVADVNGIRMPITVDMTLKIGLSKPVTTSVSIGKAENAAVVALPTQAAARVEPDAAADYLIDELGIPYDVRIEEGAALELVEWHATRGSTNDITFNAGFKGDTVGQWVTFDVTYYDEVGHSLAGVLNSAKASVYNPISRQTMFEFTCEGCVEALRNAEFYTVVIR